MTEDFRNNFVHSRKGKGYLRLPKLFWEKVQWEIEINLISQKTVALCNYDQT